MKVAEYRALIDAANYQSRSLRSVASERERRAEFVHLVQAVDELTAARCPTANTYDRQRAARCLADLSQQIAEHAARNDAAGS